MNNFRDRPGGDGIGHAAAGEKSSSAVLTQMTGVIAALNMIRVSLGMYPAGHTRIAKNLDAGFAVIQQALRNHPVLTFQVAGETLRLGGTPLDKKSAAIRDYLRTLNHHRVLSFTLLANLKKEELIEFSRILASKPSDIWLQGKINVILAKAGMGGIQVEQIDADLFEPTGAKGIVEAETPGKVRSNEFWQECLTRLAQPYHPDAKKAIQALSGQRQDWAAATTNYEAMVRGYLQALREGEEIGADHAESLRRVSSVIGELHPELRDQFLEVVGRQLSLQPGNAPILDNLKCFPQQMFLEIVNRVNEKGGQISPSLVMILQRMSMVSEKGAVDRPADGEILSTKEMERLLQREEQERYIPEAYNQMLKKAALASHRQEETAMAGFPLHEHLKSITDDQIEFRIAQLLLTLMDDETAEEAYLAYAKSLTSTIPGLIRSTQFSFLTDLIETLRRHGQEGGKPSPVIRQKALSCLQPLSDPAFLAKQVAPLIMQGSTDIREMTKFLTASGDQNIRWLFDLYLDPLYAGSTALPDILRGFGRSATGEAVKRLTGEAPQQIVLLLTFLRATADRSIVACLSELFEHEDGHVKIAVLETLLHFGEPASVALLKRGLKSSNPLELFGAVSLTCRYRVYGLSDDLFALLKRFVIRKKDTPLNDWIIGQLGLTGDPAFLPCLEKISRIRFSLTPGQLSRMKRILYGTLVNFPKASVLAMLEEGKRSSDRAIKASCAKLLKQQV